MRRGVDAGGDGGRDQASSGAGQQGGPRPGGRDDGPGDDAADRARSDVDVDPQRHDPPAELRGGVQLQRGRAQCDEREGSRPGRQERQARHSDIWCPGRCGKHGLPRTDAGAPLGLELRHLRYFVALAEVGSFTHAAERMFIAQPTLSQQIRRLEEIIGAPLLQRGREGLRLTAAGTVLLDASRDVLSLVDHGVSRTRQAAGLGRQRLRVVVPPSLPEALAVTIASRLRSAAETAGVDVAWLERPLDAEFSLIQQRQADAGLGWLTTSAAALPTPLDAMSLGEFEPEVWIPRTHPAGYRGPSASASWPV